MTDMEVLVSEFNRLQTIFNEITEEDVIDVIIYQLKSVELQMGILIKKNKL